MPTQSRSGATVLVTGGSGVLGTALARRLAAGGVAVRVFDRVPPAQDNGATYLPGDVTDAKAVRAACRGVDAVFHLAGRMPHARLDEEGFHRVNVGGTRNVIAGCEEHGVPWLLFASTIEIYGPTADLPVTEGARKGFTGVYSRNKWECEGLLLSARASGLRVSMMRMPMIVGPGFYHERSILTALRAIRKGRPLPLPGGPDVPFTCVASSDAADAFVRAWENGGADGEAFNVAAPAAGTRELFRRVAMELGSNSRIVPIPRVLVAAAVKLAAATGRPMPLIGTPAELVPFALVGGDYDTAKARRVLGWEPEHDCASALETAYRWLEEHGRL